VAPNAHLSAIRLISRNTEDYQEVGVGYKADAGNDVYSNSWGPPDDGQRLEGPGPLAYKAREHAMQVGRVASARSTCGRPATGARAATTATTTAGPTTATR
jgi:hypothetical protein